MMPKQISLLYQYMRQWGMWSHWSTVRRQRKRDAVTRLASSCALSDCCDKILDNSNSKKEGFLLVSSLKLQSMVVGKAQWEELEVTGYKAPTVRKRERNSGA